MHKPQVHPAVLDPFEGGRPRFAAQRKQKAVPTNAGRRWGPEGAALELAGEEAEAAIVHDPAAVVDEGGASLALDFGF